MEHKIKHGLGLGGVVNLKEYESPKADLIVFENEVLQWATISGCNCHYDITSNQMMIDGKIPECELGEFGHAHENPFGVAAPNWNF